MDRESLRVLLARGLSVEKIADRFGKHPSTVSYWMGKYGLDAPHKEKHAAKGGIGRERLEELVCAGLSIAEIATAVELSKATVRHWLRRYGLRTRAAERVITERMARELGQAELRLVCKRHGESDFVIESSGYYRCRVCRQEQVTKKRRALKALLVAEAGGRCVICGYDRCPAALEFHHLDRAEKRLGISGQGLTLALATLRQEAAKCVLLCSNCHAEVESGVLAVPVKCGSGPAVSAVAQSADPG
jgi:transposase